MAQVETQYHTEKFQQEIDALVRIFLPEIQKFYETEAGRRAFEEWKLKQADSPKNMG